MRKKSETRRQAILDTARCAFEALGFEQTTMSDIAARLGSSKATLYSYFKSKEALFLELMKCHADEQVEQMTTVLGHTPEHEDAAAAVLALLRPSEDLVATLHEVGTRGLEMLYSPEKQAARRMMITASADEAFGRAFYERGVRQGMQLLEDFFAGVIAAGQLRPSDPRVAAAHFRALIEAEVLERWLSNALPPLTTAQIKGHVERAVAVFMAAYGPL